MKQEKPIISTRSQDRDYNCGVFALGFILSLLGVPVNVRGMETELAVTEKDGTRPEAIQQFLHHRMIWAYWLKSPKGKWGHMQFPAIVLHRQGGDDHYSVLLSEKQDVVTMYDPEFGRIHTVPIAKFVKSWWTRRHGAGLWMHVSMDQ